MKKLISSAMLVLLTFGGGVMVYADDAGTNVAPQSFMQKIRGLFENKKDVRIEATDAVKAVKQKAQDEIEKIREENASSSEKKMEIKDLREKVASSTKEIRDRMASSTEKIKEKVEEAQKKMQEKKTVQLEKRIENRFDKMTDRYMATIEREESIMAKVSSRINKIKTGGGNTDTADKLVLEAQTHLTEARTAYTSLATIASSTEAVTLGSQDLASTTGAVAKGILTSMRKAGMEIEKHLQEAHKALEKAVGSLKGSSGLHNATSTKETN